MLIECNKSESGVVHCIFEGEMDTNKSFEAEQEVMHNIKGAEKVIFDLKKVNYVSSSFLRLCWNVFRNIKNGNFFIINVSPNVRKVFKTAGLVEHMNID